MEARQRIQVPSSVDGSHQPAYLTLPPGFGASGPPVPMVVSLHTWSSNLEYQNPELAQLVAEGGWTLLAPDFRGRNDHPEALGSSLAQQDILDAVGWVAARHPVAREHVYLTGVSGGGHMTMLMAGRHPGVWAAASAWAGISDLVAWYASRAADNYGAMMRSALGGAPTDSPAIEARYRDRSPLTHLQNAKDVALEIATGIRDGHTGAVPIHQSLAAFNCIALASGEPPIGEVEMQQLSQPDGRLAAPTAADAETDPALGRAILLRRRAGRARVTIFDGGHEGIAGAAMSWFEQHGD
jgi:dienelactone hydrolase